MTILTKQFEQKNVDWVIAGQGDARDGETTVAVNGVTGDVRNAYIYWGELNFSGSSDANITINGNAISGERLGTSVDTCWGSDHSIGYFADITSLVGGDGSYKIAGMGQGGQGASVIVVYDDGDATNNRDITLFAGNDSTDGAAVTTINLGTLDYQSDNVTITLNVGDGQSFTDGEVALNGNSLGSNQFSGASGALWDVISYDITSQLSVGSNKLTLTSESVSDCLQHVSVIVDKKAVAPDLFLDFNTAIPIDYYIASTNILGLLGLSQKETYKTKAGSEPLGVFTPQQMTDIVKHVQDTFDRSGIAMNVTQTQPSSSDYHTVRFTSTKLRYDKDGDGTDDRRLLGQAYEGVDRYNADGGNNVAVLMDGADPILAVAQTVAHEAAHAFGVRHVNPFTGNGIEVMDYHAASIEKFTDSVVNVTEPPEDGKAATSITHNPAYHIRQYVNGESDAQLRSEGLNPGTWDRGFFNNILYKIGLSNLSPDITSLAILISDASDLIEGADFDDVGYLVPLVEDLSGLNQLLFSLPESTEFRIVGSTDDETVVDVVLQDLSQNSSLFKAAQDEEFAGKLVVNENGKLVEAGDFDLTVEKVEQVVAMGENPTQVLTVSIDETSISENGGVALITISRGALTVGDLDVLVASNDTSEALVSNNVIIKDGKNEVTIPIDALDDNLIDGAQTVIITALADDFVTGSASIQVIDDETPTLIVDIFDAEIKENLGQTNVTVTRLGPTVGDLIVTMAVDDPNSALLSESQLTILNGSDNASTTLKAVDNNLTNGDKVIKITAVATGFDSISDSVVIKDDDLLVPNIDGTSNDDTLVGTNNADMFNGLGGDDTIFPLGGADTITLGAGIDQISGAPSDLYGDTVTDFTKEDRIHLTGSTIPRSDISVTSGSAILGIDEDGDGAEEGSFTLLGDFSSGDFMAVVDGTDTVITFHDFLPVLSDGAAVDPALVNGVINELFLTGNGTKEFTIDLRDMGYAEYDSALGVYEVDGAGNIVDTRLLFNSTNANKTATTTVSNVEDGNTLGFFIVQNAGSWASGLDPADTFSFVTSGGSPANLSDGLDVQLAVNGAATDQTVFHGFESALNADGIIHAVSGVETGGGRIVVGFEDLFGGGDRDYEDVVFAVTPFDTTGAII